MKFPNKLFDYKESVLFDCSVIMRNLLCEMSVLELYSVCRKKSNGIQEFFDALDVLYALDKIKYDNETRRISRVNRSDLR